MRVCVNGERGAVCDSGWNYDSARVACVSAGYSQYGKNSCMSGWSEKVSFFQCNIHVFNPVIKCSNQSNCEFMALLLISFIL